LKSTRSQINRFGEYVGGFVAAGAALAGLALVVIEAEHLRMANAILAGLVLSEVVSGVANGDALSSVARGLGCVLEGYRILIVRGFPTEEVRR